MSTELFLSTYREIYNCLLEENFDMVTNVDFPGGLAGQVHQHHTNRLHCVWMLVTIGSDLSRTVTAIGCANDDNRAHDNMMNCARTWLKFRKTFDDDGPNARVRINANLIRNVRELS